MDWTGAIEKSGDGLSVAWDILHFLVVMGFVLVTLILPRLGIYSIAKRRGIKHPWLAWLPVGDRYILGGISDQYQIALKGRRTYRRRLLPIFGCLSRVAQIGTMVLFGMILLYALFMLFAIVFSLGLVFLHNDLNDLFGVLCEPFVVACIIGSVSTCGVVMRYIALKDLYKSCSPMNSTSFLVMSIIVPVAEPFFIFLCRDLDDGMPPALRIPSRTSAPTAELQGQ